MSTFTKEQLIASAHARIEFAEMMLAGELEPLKERTWSIELALARIALASLEAEPYGYVHKAAYGQAGSCGLSSDHEAYRDSSTHIAVYTTPPAPVSMKDHQIRELVNELRDIAVEYHGTQQLRERIARTVRAAMLQGADGKPELTVWYGAMPETNGKTNWTAMLHREGQHPWEGITIDRSEYPDRVRYEADRMRHLIGELADEPDILAYDADAHSGYVYPGNPPVIPDGWVACSERMPEEGSKVIVFRPRASESNDPPVKTATYKGGREYYHGFDCYCEPTHWMPMPAAPQQEVKP